MTVINNFPGAVKVLQEMQRIKNASQGYLINPIEEKASFNHILKSAVEKINDAQQAAQDVKMKFELNDPNVSIADVMLKTQKENVYFQLGLQARNKLISAYKEIMSMPV